MASPARRLAMQLTVLVGLTLLAVTGCGASGANAPSEGSADYPVYTSVEELIREADLVAVVTVEKVDSREADDGGSNDPADSVPMAFWRARVVTVLRGQVDGASIVVAWPDLEKEMLDGRSALASGQTVVVLARRLTRVDAPGIESQDVFYTPVGGDHGVLDVRGPRLVPRAPAMEGLTMEALRSVLAQEG